MVYFAVFGVQRYALGFINLSSSMSITTTLKQSAQENIVALSIGTIPTTLAGLLAWAWPDALQKIADAAIFTATTKQLLVTLCISLLANAVLVALLISSRRTEPKLHARFGVYWDKDGNSYCPKCKNLTAQIGWATYANGQWHGLRCSCSELPFVLIESGKPIHAQDAMCKMHIA